MAVYLRERCIGEAVESRNNEKGNILKEIAKIGNNINQIARYVNKKQTAGLKQLKEVHSRLGQIVEIVSQY